jgi:hypothetical protein
MFVKTTSKATISIKPPAEVQLSAPRMKGKFRIKCVDNAGMVSYTKDMTPEQNRWFIELRIMFDCQGMADKMEVFRSDAKGDYDLANGWTYNLWFNGLDKKPGLYEIVAAEDGTFVT